MMPQDCILKGRTSFRNAVFITTLTLVLTVAFSESALCQETKENDKPGSKQVPRTPKSKITEDLTHWKILLDTLAVETRLLEPEGERPLVIADVADAYWRVDQNQAKKLFIEAFDAALALQTTPTPTTREPVALVLAKIAKRDRDLAKELSKRLLAIQSEEKRSSSRSLGAARQLLKSDPKFAVELAKLSTSLGPSMSGLWMVFEVAQNDPAGAAEIYNAYMANLRVTPNPELSSVLWLAGYPLGYGEAYGGSLDPVSLTGFGGLRVPGLQAQPDLAAAYLRVAFGAVTNTLNKAAKSGLEERDTLNALALFSVSYLLPEVQRYSPGAEGAWSGLYRQALAGMTEQRRVAVEMHLRSILSVRARASENESGEKYAERDADEKLNSIEKLPDACSRDRAYSEISLGYSYAKDFRRARQIADRIEGLALRGNVLQFTYYDEASDLVENGDLVRASDWVEKLAAKEQRALLYVRIANAAWKKSDKSMALDLLNRSRQLVRDSDDAEFQAGVLLSVAAIYAQFDPTEATYATKEAVKAFNRIKERVSDNFSILRRVKFSCTAADDGWYGGREQVETFNLYETLGAIAKSEAQGEGAFALASEIQDKASRIRAQLSIIRAVVK